MLGRGRGEEEAEAEVVDDEGSRAFARFVEQVADGRLHDQLSVELHTLLQIMQATTDRRDIACKGELTVKFKFKLERNGVLHITPDVKRKDPADEVPAGVGWLTPGGNYTAENPRQALLPGIREVPGGRGAAREVDSGKGAAREV